MWCAHTRIAGGVGMSFLKVIESSYIIHPSHSIRRYYIKYTLISSCVVSNVCPEKINYFPTTALLGTLAFVGQTIFRCHILINSIWVRTST